MVVHLESALGNGTLEGKTEPGSDLRLPEQPDTFLHADQARSLRDNGHRALPVLGIMSELTMGNNS